MGRTEDNSQVVHGIDEGVEETQCDVINKIVVLSSVLVLHQPFQHLVLIHQITCKWNEVTINPNFFRLGHIFLSLMLFLHNYFLLLIFLLFAFSFILMLSCLFFFQPIYQLHLFSSPLFALPHYFFQISSLFFFYFTH